jgi:hypothetical protein
MKKIRIVLYGVGAISCLISKQLLANQGVEIVGAIDIARNKIGKDLGEILSLGRPLGVEISNSADEVLSRTNADIVVHATSSFLKQTFPQYMSIIANNVNVVSTCEELIYPYPSEPQLSSKLDETAKKHDVTILGTGINPGFLMDSLVIMLTAPCQAVRRVNAVRVMNAATRRLPFQNKVGVGLTVAEFQTKIASGQMSGHVGLQQSIAMIADALCWKLSELKVGKVEPVIANERVSSHGVRVEAGKVTGIVQKAMGLVDGNEVITLEFSAYAGAGEEYDQVTIEGTPTIKQRIQPCVHGDIGTVAMVVNSIPRVIDAPAGLITMKDLPLPAAVLGDMRFCLK